MSATAAYLRHWRKNNPYYVRDRKRYERGKVDRPPIVPPQRRIGPFAPTPDEVVDIVAAWGLILRSRLFGRCRDQRCADVRAVAMYLIRRHCMATHTTGGGLWSHRPEKTEQKPMSFPAIGAYFQRDHSTVIYACNKIQRRCVQSPAFAAALADLARRVRDRELGCAA